MWKWELKYFVSCLFFQLSAGIYNFGAQTALEITASSSYAPATVVSICKMETFSYLKNEPRRPFNKNPQRLELQQDNFPHLIKDGLQTNLKHCLIVLMF